MVFKINNVDFSSAVVIDSYTVNKKDTYTSWTNANYKEIRKKVAEKVEGTLTLCFPTMAAFNTFRAAVENNRADDLTNIVMLSVNNTNTTEGINAFITYEPKRSVRPSVGDYLPTFSVKIEEA